MKMSSYRCMRTLINVFRRSKSLVSKAFVILTDDVKSDAPQTMDRFDAVIKLCSRVASTLQRTNVKNISMLLFDLRKYISKFIAVVLVLLCSNIKLTVSDVVINTSAFLVIDNQLCSNHFELIQCLPRFLCQNISYYIGINRKSKRVWVCVS